MLEHRGWMVPQRLLIIEDNRAIAMDLEFRAMELGVEQVAIAAGAAEAVGLVLNFRPHAALLDFRLGRTETSAGVAAILHEYGIPFVMVSGNPEEARVAIGDWATAYLTKPLRTSRLLAALEESAERAA